jgi:hypothetical protein
MSRPARPSSHAAYQALLGAWALLMTAALFWLAASSRLAAVGVRIDRLNQQREVLLQERSDALVAYARATDPTAMEERARALGLEPAEAPLTLPLGAPGADVGAAAGLGRIVAVRTRIHAPGSAAPDGTAAVRSPLASTAALLAGE